MAKVPPVQLHPDIDRMAFLLGTWRGEGRGEYPTIEPFGYGEELRFWHVGKPFLAYAQRTWTLDGGQPLHAESGYWRYEAPDRVELVVAHPFGVVEVLEGRVEATRINLSATAVARTSTALEISSVTRTVEVQDGTLRYSLAMAAVGQPLQRHLTAALRQAE